jgi:hypothetical protein
LSSALSFSIAGMVMPPFVSKTYGAFTDLQRETMQHHFLPSAMMTFAFRFLRSMKRGHTGGIQQVSTFSATAKKDSGASVFSIQ